MSLYLIGLGIGDGKSLTLKALETLKNCKKVYLENYTSVFQGSIQNFEKLIGKKIITADRNFVENYNILNSLKEDIAFLVVGDVFSATTHISLFQEAKKNKVPVEVINNASILTAVGITGLELYKFGKVASIPFDSEKINTPIKILKDNQKIDAHTLFLLDLNPGENKYLSIRDAIEYLERNNVDENIVGCARLGSENFVVKYGDMKKIKNFDFGKGPYCLVVPAKKLHFVEEESLEKWKI